jgi:pyruvate kinase
MLSGETAKGKYPIEAVKVMAETAYLAENSIAYQALFDQLRQLTARPTETAETLAMSAVAASIEQGAGAIIVLSTSGISARFLSKFRPQCPIICVTRSEQTARQLHLSRGVYPVHYPEPRGVPEGQWQIDVDNRIRFGLGNALKLGIIKPDATIMAVQGWKGGLGHTNTLRILS